MEYHQSDGWVVCHHSGTQPPAPNGAVADLGQRARLRPARPASGAAALAPGGR